MTPSARLAAAIEILDELARGDAPIRDVLAGYFRKRRYAGSKDRAAIRARVYDVVRDLSLLKWKLVRAAGDADRPRNWVFAACASEGADIASLFSGNGYAPAALDTAETSLAEVLAAREQDDAELPDAVRYGCPDWLEAHFRASLGDDFVAELAALNRTAPVDLRVDLSRASRNAVRKGLEAAGIEAEPTPFSPAGLRLSGHADLKNVAPFREGLIEPQDEGSQMLALAVGAVPGERIVDYCAGAGGKTLALASAMTGQGRIVACDVSAARLRRMSPRLERAGVAAMVEFHEISAGGTGEPLPPETADRVLVDAPCSGTGTWRRHPFQRWRVTPSSLAEVVRVQQQVLERAAQLVRPGGRLVYATCSLLDVENREQADRFAGSHADFTRLAADECLPAFVRPDMVTSQGDLRLTPARHGTDGVYAALFERKAA